MLGETCQLALAANSLYRRTCIEFHVVCQIIVRLGYFDVRLYRIPRYRYTPEVIQSLSMLRQSGHLSSTARRRTRPMTGRKNALKLPLRQIVHIRSSCRSPIARNQNAIKVVSRERKPLDLGSYFARSRSIQTRRSLVALILFSLIIGR